jgi:hypothetical protein
MIRRDYILRMIQELSEALARIKSLKKDQLWQETATALDKQFDRLVGAGAQAVAQLSDTELFAKLIQGDPTLVVRYKTLMLTALLMEAGDLATSQGRIEEGNVAYLKGLHLLLQALAGEEIADFPDFVPRVESFVMALQGALPPRTQGALMQHYERTGEFAKAEDALFDLLESDPTNPAILDFGISFYERLQCLSDAALAAGNLPRPEIESGLAELRERKRGLGR